MRLFLFVILVILFCILLFICVNTNVYIHIHNYTDILSNDDVDMYACGGLSVRTVRYDPLYCYILL